MRTLNRKETYAGIFLILVAILALWLTWPLGRGGTEGPGPGYVPKLFAWLLICIGALMLWRSTCKAGDELERFHPRPLILVLGSVGFFALTIERLGLVVSLVGLIPILFS